MRPYQSIQSFLISLIFGLFTILTPPWVFADDVSTRPYGFLIYALPTTSTQVTNGVLEAIVDAQPSSSTLFSRVTVFGVTGQQIDFDFLFSNSARAFLASIKNGDSVDVSKFTEWQLKECASEAGNPSSHSLTYAFIKVAVGITQTPPLLQKFQPQNHGLDPKKIAPLELKLFVDNDPAAEELCSKMGQSIRGQPLSRGQTQVDLTQPTLERPLPLSSATKSHEQYAAEAAEIIDQHCAKCHNDNAEEDDGGFGSLKNEPSLIQKGIVRPGDPENSKLYQVVKNNEMPQTGPELDEAQKQALYDWIGSIPKAPTVDTLIETENFTAILNDLQTQPKLLQPFIRYFLLDNLINAGTSIETLQQYQHALAKLINSLSWEHDAYLPESDAQGHVGFVRIDLRKLGWSAATWEKIQSADPFKSFAANSELKGIRKKLQNLTGSNDPIARLDWFLANGSRPPLYHEILGLPSNVKALEQRLGVNTKKAFEQGQVARAGFAQSGVSQSNRIIERYPSLYGAYWKSLDYDDNLGRRNVFTHPLDSTPAGGEVIFNLPNGFQAYMLTNAKGDRIDKAPIQIVSDPGRPDRAVENGISCFSCHAIGLLAKDDEIGALIEAAPGSFSANEVERIKILHVKREELKKLLQKDDARYQQSLGEISDQSQKEDILTPLILAFERPVSLRTVAAELSVDPEKLVSLVHKELLALPGVGPLVSGKFEVSRDVYETSFKKLDRLIKTGATAPSISPGVYTASSRRGQCCNQQNVTNVRLDDRGDVSSFDAALVGNCFGGITSYKCKTGKCSATDASQTFLTILDDGSLLQSGVSGCNNLTFRKPN